jgi:hypothetical protein
MQQPSRSAKLEDEFVGEGYHTLCLRIDELIQLQEKLGVGPNIVAQRLLRGEWLVEDIQQTIRLGLIGGGMQQREAFDLVSRSVKEGYLIDYTVLAGRLIMAALSGIEDEPLPGEAEAPTTMQEPTLFND